MMGFFRSLFGISRPSQRIALGHSIPIELKDVKYIQSSKERLEALFTLHNSFKNSPYAPKVKAVYDKTKKIHTYLIARNRLQELELFHIRNTEHFISAFTAIVDAHQQQFEVEESSAEKGFPSSQKPQREAKRETLLDSFKSEKFKENWDGMLGKPENGRSQPGTGRGRGIVEEKDAIPFLEVPTISINTFEKIPYFPEGSSARAIGYTSTSQEKHEFQQHLIHALGIENPKYIGNAQLREATATSGYSTNLYPIIHWKGFLYAVNLGEGLRLFPVQTFKKGF